MIGFNVFNCLLTLLASEIIKSLNIFKVFVVTNNNDISAFAILAWSCHPVGLFVGSELLGKIINY